MDTLVCETEGAVDVVEPFIRQSVHVACRKDEDEHKWLASQQAGRDLGESAIWQWVMQHWHGFLRARWVEHLQGKYFWVELKHCDFGLLRREFHDQRPLLDEIVRRLKDGDENLPIICWAVDAGFDREYVTHIIDILTSLDVNSARLKHRFERAPEHDTAEPQAVMSVSA
jgi:hypothetical protein